MPRSGSEMETQILGLQRFKIPQAVGTSFWKNMVIRENPYTEEDLGENFYLRTFSEDTLNEELKWHWDEEDRVVHPMHPTDWMFQLDNNLPQKISSTILIPAGEWHRIIKGTGDLTLKIVKVPKSS